VPAIVDELERPSATETFVAVKAHVDNWRWKGVPFYLRTGKRMPVRHSEIVIQFKSVPHSIFASRGAMTHPNRLLIRPPARGDDPADGDGQAARPRPHRHPPARVPLDLGLANAFADTRRRIAYERLLLDLIEGDPTCSCAATRSRRNGNGSTASAPAGPPTRWSRAPMRPGRGAVGRDRADRARRVTWND
jgi:glucose-6-phosphate 1-dehydrogenase